jgi:hypothetical protein
MELLVLTALNWRLRSVTPFTFIDFFACKVDPRGRHARCRLTARATQVILSAMQGNVVTGGAVSALHTLNTVLLRCSSNVKM